MNPNPWTPQAHPPESPPSTQAPLGHGNASSLGACGQCHGPLCVSGRMVRCETCGEPYPAHPLSVANAGTEAPRPTRAHAVLAADFAVGPEQRLARLEKRVTELEKQLAARKQQPSKQPATPTTAVA